MEEQNINVPIEVIQRRFLLFEQYKNTTNIGLMHDEEDDLADINFNFDYECIGKEAYLFHIDIGFCIKSWANILVRTSFQVPFQQNLDLLFVREVTMPMVDIALKTCVDAFMQCCENHLIAYPDSIELPKETVDNFSNTMIDLYFNYRKVDDMANKEMIDQHFLSFTPGSITQLMLNGTLMITEQVLWLHPGFNRSHNREIFPVPMPIYNTIKLKCLKIEDSKIEFNMLQSTFLLLCMDCALSLLFSDHAPLLTQILEALNFTLEDQDKYIKETNKFLISVRKSMEESGTTISNLENRPDWNSIIQ